jgi:hypothetical protein
VSTGLLLCVVPPAGDEINALQRRAAVNTHGKGQQWVVADFRRSHGERRRSAGSRHSKSGRTSKLHRQPRPATEDNP